MLICPICKKVFNTEEEVAKHSLKCWKEKNPNYQVISAPHSETKIERIINNDVFEFFVSLKGDWE